MVLQVMASWPATFLRDAGAATGVALINSIGSIGGFMGPYIIGASNSALLCDILSTLDERHSPS
jgi:hypothetical protein